MQHINIVGHSGCGLELIENDLILKYTIDNSYRNRLLKQCEKQQTFCLNQNSQNITIPKVINQINDSTKYGFVMEYFRANDFISFLEISLIEEILIKIKYLIEFVDENIKSSPITVIDKNVILKKFKEVEENINKRFFDKFVNILNLIEIKLNRMSDNISLPLGLCHGDLTFSNVLVQNENIVLIDFLDSFIETPLQDIVKLRQDTSHLWSLNLIHKECDRIKIKIIMKFLDSYIEDYFSKYDFYREYYLIFQQINLLRIVPYAKDEKIVNYLLNELKKLGEK